MQQSHHSCVSFFCCVFHCLSWTAFLSNNRASTCNNITPAVNDKICTISDYQLFSSKQDPILDANTINGKQRENIAVPAYVPRLLVRNLLFAEENQNCRQWQVILKNNWSTRHGVLGVCDVVSMLPIGLPVAIQPVHHLQKPIPRRVILRHQEYKRVRAKCAYLCRVPSQKRPQEDRWERESAQKAAGYAYTGQSPRENVHGWR